jgi:hypothetical protein
MPFSRLEAILAQNLVEVGIIDGRKDVRKPGLRARQVSVRAKYGGQRTTPASAQITAFGRIAQPITRPATPIGPPDFV